MGQDGEAALVFVIRPVALCDVQLFSVASNCSSVSGAGSLGCRKGKGFVKESVGAAPLFAVAVEQHLSGPAQEARCEGGRAQLGIGYPCSLRWWWLCLWCGWQLHPAEVKGRRCCGSPGPVAATSLPGPRG